MFSARFAQLMRVGAARTTGSAATARLWPVGLAVAMAAAGALWPADTVRSEAARAAPNGSGMRLMRSAEWETRPRSPAQQLPVCRDVRKQYSIESVIGQGGFGLVHLGHDIASKDAVAIKRVNKQSTSKDKFMQEVEILREMGGQKNIVGLREAFETSDAYVLVTELVDGEELFDRLINDGVFSETEAKELVREIAETLEYLHAHRVVHGDIKPENILLSSDSSMRLIDFGQSFRLNNTAERSRNDAKCIATMAYAAPEVIRTQTSTGSGVDMWGLGIVLFILLCGHHPFDPTNDASDEQLRDRILHDKINVQSAEWKALSADAQSLITQLLKSDPTERLTAGEVLRHTWMQ